MKRILIVEDDADNLSVIAEMLAADYETLGAATGMQGVVMAAREAPDLVLLDVNLPDLDGFEVCTRLRNQPSTRQIPVIMLTSLDGIDHRVKGLDIGADDYITKPFRKRELVARIRARLRTFESAQARDAQIIIGNLSLDPVKQEARVAGELLKLTQMEFQILRYFLERPDRLVSRKQLFSDLWPDAKVTAKTIDTHLAHLRAKLKNFNGELRTVYGSGFILDTPEQKESAS